MTTLGTANLISQSICGSSFFNRSGPLANEGACIWAKSNQEARMDT